LGSKRKSTRLPTKKEGRVDQTWKKIKERKPTKQKINYTRTERLKEHNRKNIHRTEQRGHENGKS
jgi:hypothetical protein